MARRVDSLASESVQRHVTFGVSKHWIPHIVLIHSIYYVFLSPQQYEGQSAFWTLGTFIRVLVGGKTVNAAVAFLWIVHVFEAVYTIILARRYETTFVVGVRFSFTRQRNETVTEFLNC